MRCWGDEGGALVAGGLVGLRCWRGCNALIIAWVTRVGARGWAGLGVDQGDDIAAYVAAGTGYWAAIAVLGLWRGRGGRGGGLRWWRLIGGRSSGRGSRWCRWR